MLRCREGDLAMITKGVYSGHLVDVIKFVGHSTIIRPSGEIGKYEDAWLIQSDNIEHPFAHLNPSFKKGQIHSSDSHLLPIRPGDLKAAEEREKELAE